MLYYALVLMMILGFIDGFLKLKDPSYKTTREYNNIIDFLLHK